MKLSNTPLASIIVLTHNGEKTIKQCLTSLNCQKYPYYKIIVVDNNSTDSTKKIIKESFDNVTLIENNKNLGFAKGNNLGIKKAIKEGAEYVVLVNQDTMVENNFLSEGIKIISNKKIGLASPTILYVNTNKIWWIGSKIFRGKEILKNKTFKLGIHVKKGEEYNFKGDQITSTDWIPGCALFTRKDVIKAIGLFDESFFMYGEDVDLSFRAKNKGFELVHFSGTVVYHMVSFPEVKKISKFMVKKGLWRIKARVKIIRRYFNLKEKIYFILKCFYLPFYYVITKFSH